MEMTHLIELAKTMEWPFAVMMVVLFGGAAVVTIVHRTARASERNEKIKRDAEVEQRRIDLQKVNMAIPMKKRGDDGWEG